MPQRTLVGFDRYFIQKDISAQFKFLIKAEQMAIWTDAGWVVEAGEMILIGPRRKKTRLRGFRQSEFQTSLLSYID